MSKTPYHWFCRVCRAESASSDADLSLAAARGHYMQMTEKDGEHFDFQFWKEIPQPSEVS